MKNEIKLFIALLAMFCILASLQSCTDTVKEHKQIKEQEIVDKSITFRSTNLVTDITESITLLDSNQNVYKIADSVYVLNGRIERLNPEWTNNVSKYPQLRKCNQLGGYIKYRIEED
jgi:hypothetical protein